MQRIAYKMLEGVQFIWINGNISNCSIVILLQEYFSSWTWWRWKTCFNFIITRYKNLLQECSNKLFYFEDNPLKLNNSKRWQFRNASNENFIMI